MESGNSFVPKGLYVTLKLAENIEDVRKLFKMKVYAEAKVMRGHYCPAQKQQTPTNKKGQTNPVWHHSMAFNITEPGMQLEINLYCDRTFKKNLCVGHFESSIISLSEGVGEGMTVTKVLELERGFDSIVPTVCATLKISYRFGDMIIINSNAPNPESSSMRAAVSTGFWNGVSHMVETAVGKIF